MPSRGRIRRLIRARRRAARCCGVLALLWGSVASAQNVRVVRLGDSIRSADPGSTLTLVMRVANEGPAEVSLRSRVLLPPGWRTVGGALPFQLQPGTSETRLLGIGIPANARPGPHTVHYLVGGAGPEAQEGDSAVIVVGARHDIRILPVSAPRFTPAGQPYRLQFEVRNLGNDTADVRLRLISADGLPARADSTEFRVAPGLSRPIPVIVTTPGHVDRTLTHRVEVRLDGAEAGDATSAISLVAIVPRLTSQPRARVSFPMELRVRASSPRDAESPYELSGGGRVTGTARLDFLARGAQSGPSLTGAREEYRVSLQGPGLALRAGDHVYALSPLSEIGRYAQGAEARLRAGPVLAGAFVSRPRRTSREQEERAAFLGFTSAGGLTVSAQALTRPVGERGSLWTIRSTTPYRAFALDLEYGRGLGDQSTTQAWSGRLIGSGSTIWYDVQHLRADADYPGSYRGVHRDFASLGVRPLGAFQIGVSLGQDANVLPSRAAQRVRHRRRAGWGYLAWGDALALEFRRSVTTSGTEEVTFVDRTGSSVRVRLGANARPLSLHPYAEIGTQDERLAGTKRPFHRVGVLTGIQSRSTFLHASMEYASGDVEAPMAQPTTTGALFLSTRLLRQTHLRVALNGTRHLGEVPSITGTMDATLDQGLPWRHRLVLQGRAHYVELYGATRPKQLLAEYVIPLGVPIPRSAGSTRVVGRVVISETGRGAMNVLVRLGTQTVLTDASGRWAFSGITPGTHVVDLDLTSLDADQMVLGPTPRTLEVVEGRAVEVIFEVVRSATVSGTLELGGGVNQGGAGSTPVVNAIVELDGGGMVLRRLTDTEGRFRIAGVRPGRWILRLDGEALPAHWQLPQDSLLIDLAPGESKSIALAASERVRPVRIVARGDVVAPQAQDPRPAREPMWYTVRVKDRDLADVAREVYGDPLLWPKVWLANRALLGALPVALQPGSRLRIPPKAPLTLEEESAVRHR